MLPIPAVTSAPSTADSFGTHFANSDLSADTTDRCYELDPDSGALLCRVPETTPVQVLLNERIGQMALLDGALYLLRLRDNALLRYELRSGDTTLLRRFDGEVLRFAVTAQCVYYLTDGVLRRSAPDGSAERVLVREAGLYRFWLDDGDALEYMTRPGEICRLELKSGSLTKRENAVSTLQTGLRTTSGLDRLKDKFPMGKYWNHCGRSNDPDRWTMEPCTHHGYQGSGCGVYPDQCNCNSFHDSIQCFGFAYKLADDYFGSTPDEWNDRIWWDSTNGIKAGDIFRYKNNRHTIWITGVDGDTVTYADCNYDGTCVIRWDQTVSVYTLRSSATYRDVAPATMDQGGLLAAPVVTGLPQTAIYDDMRWTFRWEPVKNAAGYRILLQKDGQTTVFDAQTSATEVPVAELEAGDYVFSAWAYDAYGSSKACTVSFRVVHVERDTDVQLWFSLYPQGEPCDELLSGDHYWLNYRIYDRTTGQGYEIYCPEFATTLSVSGPNGEALGSETFANLGEGALEYEVRQEGDYTGTLALTEAETQQFTTKIQSRTPGCADLGHDWTYSSYAEESAVRMHCEACGVERLLSYPRPCAAESCCGAAFTDMPAATLWSHEGLEFLLQNGIMNGVTATQLAPNTAMNRAMLVTLLWRIEGEPGCRRLLHFKDVKPESYYGRAVAWAAENGVVNGVSEDSFAPTNPITREQLATILYRYADWRGFAGEPSGTLSDFTDGGTVSAYAETAMRWAVGTELIRGISTYGRTTLSPKSNATRAQVATILLRLLRLPPKEQSPAQIQ